MTAKEHRSVDGTWTVTHETKGYWIDTRTGESAECPFFREACEMAAESARRFGRSVHAFNARCKEIKHLRVKELTLGLTYLEKRRLYG